MGENDLQENPRRITNDDLGKIFLLEYKGKIRRALVRDKNGLELIARIGPESNGLILSMDCDLPLLRVATESRTRKPIYQHQKEPYELYNIEEGYFAAHCELKKKRI